MNTSSPSDTRLKPGQKCAGFIIVRTEQIPALRCTAILAQHEMSGARVLHLCADDDENLIAIAFRTPPADDTGVPHILEHSVLGGSRKYPVKDPFLEMLKMSMATFLNAMTYPDKTVYPVASNVRKDFFNLADVYCDAVFHPNISPMTLRQEGHRLAFSDPEDPESPLVIQGIVYNEMKGAYSDLDSLIERTATQALFPGSPYGFDSGGDPDAIPKLTYDQFQNYYRLYYHPSNAWIFLYGNIATQEHLAFLNERLADMPPPPADCASSLPLQPRWPKPREIVVPYPADEADASDEKAAVTINWLVGNTADAEIDLAFEVIDRLLLGSAAAPLRKALVDSQLGKDLTSSGYSNGTLETTFHVGLKGARPGLRDDIVTLVMETLRKVVKEGFTEAQRETAFHQLQYSHREIQSQYPLRLMTWVYNSWIYDLDPTIYLYTGEHLERLARRCQENPGWLCRLIEERLLNNQHRVVVTLEPDTSLEAARTQRLREELALRKQNMTAAERAAMMRENEELAALQNAPNPPEAVEQLPHLDISDLPALPKAIPADIRPCGKAGVLTLPDVPTNGVNYLLLAFDLATMPLDLQQYVPVFCRLLTQMGAAGRPYTDIAELIAGTTGGISAGTFVGADALDPSRLMTYATVTMKTLDSSHANGLDILHKLLLDFDLRDDRRMADLLKQAVEKHVSNIIPSGHRLAGHHAARTLSEAAWLGELWGGVPQIRLARQLNAEAATAIDPLREKLEAVGQFIVRNCRMHASFSGSTHLRAPTEAWISELASVAAVAETVERAAWPVPANRSGRAEGLAFMADVAYCARCFPAPHASDPDSASVQVLAQLLSFDYLWDEIRAKGGAYGGFCAYGAGSQVFELLSYRDPHIERTLDVFDRTREYLLNIKWSQKEIERAVIGSAKTDDIPVRPGWATAAALWRHLGRLTEQLRQERRQQLLAVTPEQIRSVALSLFEENYQHGNSCVLASRQQLTAASQRLAEPLVIEDVLADFTPAGDAS